ncbi:hypothetical protein [Acidocella sp.]|uniref:hypothetical protein n=1 Tax=Acidocella sp. TaxID=50710 RepID=UPI002618AA2D|nr:hypothetical protein [Acidocella sp.]
MTDAELCAEHRAVLGRRAQYEAATAHAQRQIAALEVALRARNEQRQREACA